MASSPTPTHADLLALTRLSQPAKFLSLAPTLSASYPTSSSPKAKASQSPTATPVLAPTHTSTTATTTSAEVAVTGTPAVPAADVSVGMSEQLAAKSRRSSSLGSEGSANGGSAPKRRFLRLGPVHYGDDGDGKGDWSEEVISE